MAGERRGYTINSRRNFFPKHKPVSTLEKYWLSEILKKEYMESGVSVLSGRALLGVTPKGRLTLLRHLGIPKPLRDYHRSTQERLIRVVQENARRAGKRSTDVLAGEVAAVKTIRREIKEILSDKALDPHQKAKLQLLDRKLDNYIDLLFEAIALESI